MVAWFDSQCQDLPAQAIVLIEETDSSTDEPDDLHAVAGDEGVIAIVVKDRRKAPTHL